MPEITAPTIPADVDFERAKYLFEQEVDDRAAVSLVTKTFQAYESKRLTHERRWQEAAALYHGVMEKRMWTGTNIERASLPVNISYDQVEAAYPIICDALFNFWPTFFDVAPMPGTTAQEAQLHKDVIASFLETPYDETGITAIANMEMAVHQAEKYGDGIIELSWDGAKGRPVIEWVDRRDIYVDHTSAGPIIDWSPAVIHRKLMTVQQLVQLRGTEGVKIPPDDVLNYLAKSRITTMGDVAKQREALARGELFYPGEIRTDPQHQQIEVLVYWTKDRLIWVLGRIWTAINKENPYDCIPYQSAPYTVMEGRPYSMSLIDVIQGEQKYAQGIRNARLDNLALALHRPRNRASGTPTNPAKMAWAPGMVDEVSDVKQVEVIPIDNFTQQAYEEEQMIHASADKRTGVNQMAQSGMAPPSNANRNATGVRAQQSATGSRLSTVVSNFEKFMIVPMLYKIHHMIAKFAPDKFQVTNTKTGQTTTASKDVFGKNTLYRMEAASRMRTKDQLAAFLVPVTQLLFNPEIAHQANIQGKTLDFGQWSRFMQDATGTARTYEFFRDMLPQEMQAMNQPDPKTMADMQKAQLEAQTRTQMGQMKQQSTDMKTKMDYLAKTGETGEKSARHILGLLSQDRIDRLKALLEQKALQQDATDIVPHQALKE